MPVDLLDRDRWPKPMLRFDDVAELEHLPGRRELVLLSYAVAPAETPFRCAPCVCDLSLRLLARFAQEVALLDKLLVASPVPAELVVPACRGR